MDNFETKLLDITSTLQEQYSSTEDLMGLYGIMDDLQVIDSLKGIKEVKIEHIQMIEDVISNIARRQ